MVRHSHNHCQIVKFPNITDFPTINEDYRGKKYCIAYGLSAFAYSRTALVKKNVCNSEEDKVGFLVTARVTTGVTILS